MNRKDKCTGKEGWTVTQSRPAKISSGFGLKLKSDDDL